MAAPDDYDAIVREAIAVLEEKTARGSLLHTLVHGDPVLEGYTLERWGHDGQRHFVDDNLDDANEDRPIRCWKMEDNATFNFANGDCYRYMGTHWILHRTSSSRLKPSRVTLDGASWFDEKEKSHNLFGPAYWHAQHGASFSIHGKDYTEGAFWAESARILAEDPSLEMESGRLTKRANA